MIALEISHNTTYRYHYPVAFGSHRLMLRPRESRNLRLIEHDLTFEPEAEVTWANDVFGNAVATATIPVMSEQLVIKSVARLELDIEQWPVFEVATSSINYPFLLADDDMTDLGALRLQGYLDSRGLLRSWAQGFVAGNPTDTLSMLKDLCAGIASAFIYEVREDEGVQTPEETLNRGAGSCRDFAVLYVDAVRSLGFGARIVSGYLYDPFQDAIGSAGAGSTHAWAEVFVPGAGWITFDPTNRSVGGFNLVPVAVARDIRQAIPISGSFIGNPDAFKDMDVEVRVAPFEPRASDEDALPPR